MRIKKSTSVIILLSILLVSILACVVIANINFSHPIANIYQNGILLKSIDLSLVSQPYEFVVNGENNCHNTIYVSHNSICITDADCPDKICINTGAITNGVIPIVCLPNKLVIQIENDNGRIDGVAG